MILFTAKAIKVMLAIAAMLVGLRIFKGKAGKKQRIYLSLTIVVFALVANHISGFMPSLTDTITITALGEKREEAKGVEVYLDGYTVDGESYIRFYAVLDRYDHDNRTR